MSQFRAVCLAGGLLVLGACTTVSASESPTWSKDVASIVWKNCASCHRPGEVGPFSLLSYEDASKRADFIADITASRRMPPWHAEPGFGDFLDERRLSDAELATLKAWAVAGAPEGDPKHLPPTPTFTEGWQLGEPDLVLEMEDDFDVPADGRDVFRCFVIPIGNDKDMTVASAEFRPGNPRVVHHSIFFLDNSGAARKQDAKDEKQGYESFGGIKIIPSGGLGGWAPGGNPRALPDHYGQLLRKNSDLVLQIHYHPSGKPEKDRSRLGITFTKKPTTHYVASMLIMNFNINIPAGEKNYQRTAEFTVPTDIEAVGIVPHMHYIGRKMKTTAYFPDGTQQPLIWVKDWDFNWQTFYQYKEPIKLPKDTKIFVEAEYDNSADNPKNPNDPPKAVTFGEQTTDEMCLCSVQFTAKTKEDYIAVYQELFRLRMPFARVKDLFNGPGGN